MLLARVTQVKQKGEVHYVGVDAGMNSLIRPALYGAYHEIVNLTRLDEPPAMAAHVVGPICETGDVLGRSRRLPPRAEGDVMLIANAGAYGRVMSSRYNLREPAAGSGDIRIASLLIRLSSQTSGKAFLSFLRSDFPFSPIPAKRERPPEYSWGRGLPRLFDLSGKHQLSPDR